MLPFDAVLFALFLSVEDVGGEYIAKGVTDDAVRFTLKCKGEPGACAGENQVVVTESDFPPRLRGERAQKELAEYLKSLGGRPLPPLYASVVESPLKVNVQAGKKDNELNLIKP